MSFVILNIQNGASYFAIRIHPFYCGLAKHKRIVRIIHKTDRNTCIHLLHSGYIHNTNFNFFIQRQDIHTESRFVNFLDVASKRTEIICALSNIYISCMETNFIFERKILCYYIWLLNIRTFYNNRANSFAVNIQLLNIYFNKWIAICTN